MKDNNQLKVILENIIQEKEINKKDDIINENVILNYIKEKMFPVVQKNAQNIETDFKNDLIEISRLKSTSQFVNYLNKLGSDITNEKGEKLTFSEKGISGQKSNFEKMSIPQLWSLATQMITLSFKQFSDKEKVAVEEGIEKIEEFVYYNEGISRSPMGVIKDAGKSIKEKINSLNITKKQLLMIIAFVTFFGGTAATKLFSDTSIPDAIKNIFSKDVTVDVVSAANVKLYKDKIVEIKASADTKKVELPNVPGVKEKETLKGALENQLKTLDPNNPNIDVLKKGIQEYEDQKNELQKDLLDEINNIENSAEIGDAALKVSQLNKDNFLRNVKDRVISDLKSKNLENIKNSYKNNNTKLEKLYKIAGGTLLPEIDDDYAKISTSKQELAKKIAKILKAQDNLKDFFDKLDKLNDKNYNTVLPGFDEELQLKCAIAGTLDENFNPIDCTTLTLSKTEKDKDGNVILELVPDEDITKVTFNPKTIDDGYKKAIVEMAKFPGFDDLVKNIKDKITPGKKGEDKKLSPEDLDNFEKKLLELAKTNKNKLTAIKIQNLVYSKIILDRISEINSVKMAKVQKDKDGKIQTYLSSFEVLQSLVSFENGKLTVDLNKTPETVRLALQLPLNSVSKGDIKGAVTKVMRDKPDFGDTLSKKYSTKGGLFSKDKIVDKDITFIGESAKKSLNGLISVIEENYFKNV